MDRHRPQGRDRLGCHEPSPEEDRLARVVFEAALDVHRSLGAGYLESIYEEAMCLELQRRGEAFRKQVKVEISYLGTCVGTHVLDLVVGELLVVELKAVEAIAPIHLAQVRSYLQSTGLELGLLINFNSGLIKDGVRRVVHTRASAA